MKQGFSLATSRTGLMVLIGSVVLVASLLAGCATTYTVQLGYRSIAAVSAEKPAQISIGDVVNNREKKLGGASDTLVGTLRGGYGNPWALNTKNKVLITKVFENLISDAATELGYQVIPAGKAPVLSLVINKFWCDGVYGYKINIDADLNLMDPTGKTVLATKKIQYGDGFVIVVSMNEVKTAYNKFLSRMLDEVETALKSAEFAKQL